MACGVDPDSMLALMNQGVLIDCFFAVGNEKMQYDLIKSLF